MKNRKRKIQKYYYIDNSVEILLQYILHILVRYTLYTGNVQCFNMWATPRTEWGNRGTTAQRHLSQQSDCFRKIRREYATRDEGR